ncbi:AAA-associated domain-containing protein [Shewanella algae]
MRFEEELEDHMSDDFIEDTIDHAINWGRYAELFAYDDESQTFSLENPTA